MSERSDQRGRSASASPWPRHFPTPLWLCGCGDPTDRRIGRRVLVFCARRRRSDRPCCPAEFSAGAGGTWASPMAYRQSDSRFFDRTYGVSRHDRLYRGHPAGSILTGAAAARVPFESRDQNPLASGGCARRWSAAPRDINGPGAGQGTEAIRNRDLHLGGRPLCYRHFTGEACACSDPATRVRTPCKSSRASSVHCFNRWQWPVWLSCLS